MSKRSAEREQFRLRNKSFHARQIGSRVERRKILIICGGETEAWYFDRFRAIVRPHKLEVRADGVDPKRLVEWAKIIKKKEETNGAVDAVWCVFDRDDFGLRYLEAHAEAARAGFFVAASDPCFELWFLLHFREIQQVITTSNCQSLLKNLLDKPYSKTDSSLFAKLEPYREQASSRAAKLLLRHGKEGATVVLPNPSTTVHKLIADLFPDGLR